MTEYHFYEPANGHRLPHDPTNAIIAPRPIGWISTVSPAGKRNLAPYSFFNQFNYRPPIIGFCSTGWKDSVANVEATGEFVWNLATEALAGAMNATSATVEDDEFVLAGLDSLPSRLVKPDRVAASPVHFECRKTQIVQLQTADGADVDSWLVLGEVVAVHIDTAMLDDGIYQTARSIPIMRGGGPTDYFAVREEAKFQMRRPA
ncbi:Asp/Glu/hydantoin racemase [Sphingomonas sp. EC-HK361]|uniref:flavin reductase family protein n=1 Tax=Sphingomonas sp. EC-HK361 TaxID=2038397 RepID=UPI0012531C24|nr:flavin reductase family protein [Sphingomonas sp. EC-HK361]VVS96853.1 Asp/Glu/hydantoin racemase [Sphingomonas sp. EC-HK361]